jgi:hypothetical protein
MILWLNSSSFWDLAPCSPAEVRGLVGRAYCPYQGKPRKQQEAGDKESLLVVKCLLLFLADLLFNHEGEASVFFRM